MGASLGLASAGLGLVGNLGKMFGGGNQDAPARGVQMPAMYQLPDMNTAAYGALSGNAGLGQYNIPASLIPQYQAVVNQMGVNNPNADAIRNMIWTASDRGFGAGQNAINTGNALTGNALNMYGYSTPYFNAGTSLLGYIPQVMNQAFDPQSALYGRTAQQLREQTRAAQAARGLETTPYGAGVEGQTMGNFNIDWQNNLLNRMLMGAGGAGTLAGGANTLAGAGTNIANAATYGANTGANLAMQGAGGMQTSAMFPYTASNQMAQDTLGGLNSLAGAGQSAAVIPQQIIDNYLRYINAGTGATNAATGVAGAGLKQADLGFNQQRQTGMDLGSSLAGLAKNWPSGLSFGWGKQ